MKFTFDFASVAIFKALLRRVLQVWHFYLFLL